MASTNIQRTLGQNSNSGKLTISVWVKRAGFGEQGICGSWYSGAYHGILYFNSNNQLTFYDYRNSYIMQKVTTAKFRDVGAWYHIVCNFDHTLGSPTGKIYVNGVEQTLSTDVNYTQGATSSWLTDYTFNIGTYNGSGNYFNGNMSDFYFIQGYVYEASTFGETDSTSGIWKPITEPTVNYSSTGGNSCHLKFENSANLDLDSGDNNLTFTTSGTLTQNVDTPSNVFATWNPLSALTTPPTFSNGNLTAAIPTSGGAFRATLAVSKGKWYCETKLNEMASSIIGIQPIDTTYSTNIFNDGAGIGLYSTSGTIYRNTSSLGNIASVTNGDIIGMAIDLDNNNIYFSKNGQYASGISGSWNQAFGSAYGISITSGNYYTIAGSNGSSSSTGNFSINFGQGYFGTTAVASSNSDGAGLGLFEYSVPSGFYSLCTKNIKNYG